jgi:hypothetical protein
MKLSVDIGSSHHGLEIVAVGQSLFKSDENNSYNAVCNLGVLMGAIPKRFAQPI